MFCLSSQVIPGIKTFVAIKTRLHSNSRLEEVAKFSGKLNFFSVGFPSISCYDSFGVLV